MGGMRRRIPSERTLESLIPDPVAIIDSKIEGMSEKQQMVEDALTKASEGIGFIEKARDMFFKGGENQGQGWWDKSMNKIKGFFGFSLAQMENNPHFQGRDLGQERSLMKEMLLKMEKIPESQREHFILSDLLGIQ